MTKHLKNDVQEKTALSSASLLQRKCACGHHTGGAECAECTKKRITETAVGGAMLHPHGAGNREPEEPPGIVHTVLSSPDKPVSARARSFPGQRVSYDFSQLRVHSGTGLRFVPHTDQRLPAGTPAWTEHGRIHLGASALFLPPKDQQTIMRHESVHSLHQLLGISSDTASARQSAEDLASRGERGTGELDSPDFYSPVPSLLAFPPQKYSPWSNVWIGHPGIIGEVTESEVVVRIFKSFDDLGVIKRGPDGMATMSGPQSYECGKHDAPPIPDIAAKMKKVAQKTADTNARIPDTKSPQRVAGGTPDTTGPPTECKSSS